MNHQFLNKTFNMNIEKTYFIVLIFGSCFIALTISLLSGSKLYKTLSPVPTFCEFANSCGKHCEDFNITTEDGYILQQFHIPGDPNKPVLLIPGILESSDIYIVMKNISLAITLADEGYDVWIANNRGNRYSRRHETLNPDTDAKFWNYSIHELGVYDIPPTIDYILDKTGQTALSIVGHSEGTTIIFILTSERPKYNVKIKVLACLAAIAYVEHIKGRLGVAISLSPLLNTAGHILQYDEVLGFYSDEKSIIRKACNSSASYELCVVNGFFRQTGSDPEQFPPESLPGYVSIFPSGTSRKNFIHYAQIGIKNKFARFDYGPIGNQDMYGAINPPEYDFSKMKIDVALYRGLNDYISVPEDVDHLKRQLPNVVEDVTLEYALWNHIDHVIGLYMPKYLYPHLLKLLNKYT